MLKPNILLIMADEHPVFMTGCYGHRSARTPAIDSLADNGITFDAAYEWSARVPLIISGPGIKPGRRIKETVSLLDIGQTLCSLTNTPPIYDISDGRDISDLILGDREEKEGLAIMENYAEGVLRGWRMLRKGKYKLNYIPGHRQELFNLEKDPDEWNNLAELSEYKNIVEEMTTLVLKDWDPDSCDEKRYQSEERRIAILKAWSNSPKPSWQFPSPAVPHPLGY